jgi:Arm DNA-binding domain
MAKKIERLTALGVQKCSKAGYHADGAGLYLQVSKGGGKSWVFRYMLRGKPREMGLGSHVSLEIARQKAAAARAVLADGMDPIDARDAQNQKQALEQARSKTFGECAEAYIKAHQAGWRNAKHGAQWEATLNTYAAPVFGSLPIQAIDTALVMKVLEPIWTDKTETASRVVGERTGISLQLLQLRPDFTAQAWDEPVSHLTGKHQLIAFVVANDQCIQRVVWCVAANDERLRLVHLVFEPCTAAFPGLVTGVLTLSDDALEAELLHQRD